MTEFKMIMVKLFLKINKRKFKFLKFLDHVIENSETSYSKRSTLKIPYVQFSHSGKYTCVVFDLNGQKYSKEITYRVSSEENF